jgi:hypothetical protein
LAYADYVNILVGRVHITEKNTNVLVVAIKNAGLEVTCDKTNYMIISQDMDENKVTI